MKILPKIRAHWREKPLSPLPVGAAPGTLVVDRDAPKPQISVTAYGPESLVEESIGEVEEARAYLGEYPVTWVNVDGLGDSDMVRALGDVFGVHPLAQEDILNVRHRPKLEQYDDQIFIVTRMAGLEECFEYEQLSLFLGPNYVLTLQQRPGDCLGPVRNRLRQARGALRTHGADYLAYAILDAVVDSYFPVLEEYGERLDALEEEILMRPKQSTILRVQAAKRDMLSLRRSIWPQREFLNSLVREPSTLVTERTQTYLRDAHDHAVRIMDLVDTYREISAGLTDLYMSSVSNRMNDVMKVLTVIATIFIPLTFVAGIYGMNFNTEVSPFNMPELNWYWAYPAFWIVLISITAVLLVFFRRKRWIGGGNSPDQ